MHGSRGGTGGPEFPPSPEIWQKCGYWICEWEVGTLKQRSPSSKFLFSENGRHIALIFGMQHLLVDLYQVCSYDAPWVKIGPPWGRKFEHRNKEGKIQNSSSLNLEGLQL